MKPLLALGMLITISPSATAQSAPSPNPELSPVTSNLPEVRHVDEQSLLAGFEVHPKITQVPNPRPHIVGSYELLLSPGLSLQDAWAPGFLPVALSISDGRCVTFEADYYGTLRNGRISSECAFKRASGDQPTPRLREGLRYVSSSWGYEAWVDDRRHRTLIMAPGTIADEPLMVAPMITTGFMAMSDPHGYGAAMTLVGLLNGKTMIVTLEVNN